MESIYSCVPGFSNSTLENCMSYIRSVGCCGINDTAQRTSNVLNAIQLFCLKDDTSRSWYENASIGITCSFASLGALFATAALLLRCSQASWGTIGITTASLAVLTGLVIQSGCTQKL